jgi:CubicO group peptidase (beta-lactamase class C family)
MVRVLWLRTDTSVIGRGQVVGTAASGRRVANWSTITHRIGDWSRRTAMTCTRVALFGRWTALMFQVLLILSAATALVLPSIAVTKAFSAAPISSQELTATADSNRRTFAPQMTPEDLSALFDGLVPLYMQQKEIAGAVIAIVKDGKTIFAKGYGYADIENGRPVSPENTLFRLNSISKLFTWTAVMQQVEAGKIDLDADINQYLDFKIPTRFQRPITMRDLMTHTPGFEQVIKDIFVHDPRRILPLGEYLKTHLPEAIFPPGTTVAYSNYGTGLAGYVVQRVSGEPFDEYIERHILEPLGMKHTTFRRPLPESLAPLMSRGYLARSAGAQPLEFGSNTPASELIGSAEDMTHFMIAQLRGGAYDGSRILLPEAIQQMHARQYAPDPRVNGVCLGFWELTRNGHRIIGHAGDSILFRSALWLIPDADVGLFVAYNSTGPGIDPAFDPQGPVFHQFMDRYFPYAARQPNVPNTQAEQDARRVSGTYIPSQRSQSGLLYLPSLLTGGTVSAGKDGILIFGAMPDPVFPKQIEAREAARDVWYDPADPQNIMVFRQDRSGRWEYAVQVPPIMVYQQARWYESKAFISLCLVFSLGVFGLTLVLWPVAALIRWHYGRRLEAAPRQRRVRAWARAVCALNLIFWMLYFGTLIYGAAGHLEVLSSAADPWFRFIQMIGWLGVIGTALALWSFQLSVSVRGQSWWVKVQDAVIAAACLVSLWLIWFGHVLSFSVKY